MQEQKKQRKRPCLGIYSNLTMFSCLLVGGIYYLLFSWMCQVDRLFQFSQVKLQIEWKVTCEKQCLYLGKVSRKICNIIYCQKQYLTYNFLFSGESDVKVCKSQVAVLLAVQLLQRLYLIAPSSFHVSWPDMRHTKLWTSGINTF